MKMPGPDHPITIEPAKARVRVRLADTVIADTTRALCLKEASYPPAYYLPREDADMATLERTDNSTHCPYKGDASYFTVTTGGQTATDAVWTYEAPYQAVSAIEGHLAFYSDKAEVLVEPLDARSR